MKKAKAARRPWERVIRVTPAKPERVTVRSYRQPRPPTRASVLLAIGFLVLISIGTAILSLPWANRMGEPTPFLTALFTATSAICVTGLVVVDTKSYWSPFGQAVILFLIQVGGLGFITSSTVLFLLIGRRVGLRERLLLRESQGITTLGGIMHLTRQVVLVTLTLQAVGALILSLRFATEFPLDWALWLGVFHSVSAFNNAGFDLFGDFRSLVGYSLDPVIVLTIGALVLMGAISFTVIVDVARERKFRSLLLDTKLVLVAMAGVVAVGTLGILALEYGDPETLGPMGFPHKLMNALFMTLSRTAGFSTVNVSQMSEASLLLLTALMYVGAASGSMGGGVKLNTFAVLTAAVISSMRGQTVTTAFGKELPQDHISRALTIAFLALTLVFALTLILTLTEPFPVLQLMFEATSAFSIVGLSTGITPDLSTMGKMLIVGTMYVGRVGPLTLALALAERARPLSYRYPEDRVKIG